MRDAVESAYNQVKAWDAMRANERRAAELLVEILRARTWEARDVGAAQGMHDLDVVMSDGTVVAVEVTSDTSGADRAFDSAVREIDPIMVPGLPGLWFVDVSPPGDNPDDNTKARRRARELDDKLPGLLAEVERCARHEEVKRILGSRRNDSELVEQLRALEVLGVRKYELDERGPRVHLVPAVFSGSTGADEIPAAVQRHVQANRDKLIAARDNDAASEAHLFVWLQLGQPHRAAATSAVWSGSRFNDPYDLCFVDLQGIDAAWVAVDCDPPSAYHLHRSPPVYRFKSGCWTRWRPMWCQQ